MNEMNENDKKMICIKEYSYYKVGDIETLGNIIIGELNKQFMNLKTMPDIFEYFMPLAEWREQQIKSILDD